MAIGINWAEIWGPVWGAVWRTTAGVPEPDEETPGGRGAVTGFTRYRSSPREPLPPIIDTPSDDALMAEVQEVLAVLFSLEVFT